MTRIVSFLLVVIAGAGVANAEDMIPVTLGIGESEGFEVGLATGSQCDDPSVASAEMAAKDQTTNVFVVTGLHAGTTMCRAGAIEGGRPSFLFLVTVIDNELSR